MEKPIIRYTLAGPSGNIFFILGRADEEMKRQQREADFSKLRDRVFKAKSYEEALDIIGEEFTLIDMDNT